MSRVNLPDHIHSTERAWKSRKRKEWDAVVAALKVFHLGCAFTPVYDQFDGAVEAAEDIRKRLSVKEWGR